MVDDAGERAQGLMFRESLPKFSGMLFVYETPQPVAFWMKNTLIPLDMLFFDAQGRLMRIQSQARPLDETPVVGGDNVRYVLEINGGLAEQLGHRPRRRAAPSGPERSVVGLRRLRGARATPWQPSEPNPRNARRSVVRVLCAGAARGRGRIRQRRDRVQLDARGCLHHCGPATAILGRRRPHTVHGCQQSEGRSMIGIALPLIGGLALLIVGGELLVRGAVQVAIRFGVSPLVIGLTLVGFGTSTPELVTSVQAALSGSPGIAYGNIVGSNIANILLILGAAAVLTPIRVASNALKRDSAVMLAAAVAFTARGGADAARHGGGPCFRRFARALRVCGVSAGTAVRDGRSRRCL